MKEEVWGTTGADGNASLVFTPGQSYGYYLDPASSIVGDTVTLPEPVDIDKFWNRFTETYNVRMYAVINDDPYFGKVGAEELIGEIPWETWGTPGQTSYKTNGRRLQWKNFDGPILPTDIKTTFSPDSAPNHPFWLSDPFCGQVRVRCCAPAQIGSKSKE